MITQITVHNYWRYCRNLSHHTKQSRIDFPNLAMLWSSPPAQTSQMSSIARWNLSWKCRELWCYKWRNTFDIWSSTYLKSASSTMCSTLEFNTTLHTFVRDAQQNIADIMIDWINLVRFVLSQLFTRFFQEHMIARHVSGLFSSSTFQISIQLTHLDSPRSRVSQSSILGIAT